MFEKLKDIFSTVTKLAFDRRITYEGAGIKSRKSGENSDKLFESIKNPNKQSPEYKLQNYLENLNFETIKIIQTIMYLGRDNEYSNFQSPKARYEKLREDFDKQGWATKEIEIRQMVGKIPLDEYLNKGFEILEIEI
jgi:hypothetical protein